MSTLRVPPHNTRIRLNVLLTQEESWYVAKCLENSIASQGKSVEEAIVNLKEALELYYKDADQEIRQSVPGQAFLTTLEVALP
jgi:predicted RNase H-like HicB family nuclease